MTTEGPDQSDPTLPTYAPSVDDFELTVKTLAKECFGTAGCNATFRVELAYGGRELDPTTTYELTYEIHGGEDPLINTLTVTGDEYVVDEEEFIGTTSSNADLTAEVLDVSER